MIAILLLGLASVARAQDTAQPYIDSLKEGMEPEERTGGTEPYIDRVRERLKIKGEAPESSEGYAEQLKEGMAEKKVEEGSYSEKIHQSLLNDGKDQKSAIEAVKEGTSELKARRIGEIHHAFGFRYGVSATRDISGGGDTQLRPFNDVYGSSYVPDIGLFWEYQPWHSEWFGNIGIYATLDVSFFQGKGTFRSTLNNPKTGLPFSGESDTTFQFFQVPVALGLDYRFNLARIIRPFVVVAPMLIGYVEARNDNIKGNRGYSKGLFFSGGASLFLDWIAPGATNDLYQQFGVKHYYLTVEFVKVTSIASEVSFNNSGVSLGLTYEF